MLVLEDYFKKICSENTKNTKWAVSTFKQWIVLCKQHSAVNDTVRTSEASGQGVYWTLLPGSVFVSGGSLENERWVFNQWRHWFCSLHAASMSPFSAMFLLRDVSPFVVPHEANSALSRTTGTYCKPSFHAIGAVCCLCFSKNCKCSTSRQSRTSIDTFMDSVWPFSNIWL